jgi:hypothetical protein
MDLLELIQHDRQQQVDGHVIAEHLLHPYGFAHKCAKFTASICLCWL